MSHELQDRWRTPAGSKLREELIKSIQRDENWSLLLHEFSYEGPYGKQDDLRGIDFSGLVLQGIDLSYAALDWADLTRCNLTGANFQSCSMNDATLKKATLRESNLFRVSAKRSHFEFCDLTNCHAMGADFTGAFFQNAHLTGAALSHSVLSGADLSNADMVECDVYGAVLPEGVGFETDSRGKVVKQTSPPPDVGLAGDAWETATSLMRETTRPVDKLLSDIAWLKRFVGLDPQATERLQQMTKQTQTIRNLILGLGETLIPYEPADVVAFQSAKARLRGKRVLIADADETVRAAGHEFLERYGCVVETADSAETALLMILSYRYDVAFYDADLTDIDLSEALEKIRSLHEFLPVVLMKGYGYDGAHQMVKAWQMGFKFALLKPFRWDSFLVELEKAFTQGGN